MFVLSRFRPANFTLRDRSGGHEMATVAINATRRKTETLKRSIESSLEDGNDVIIHLGENARPERVLKILSATAGEWRVEVVLRHAELREYLEHALAGAAAGGFIGGSASLLTAITLGNPVSLAAVLASAGLGAAIGAVLGLASTPCTSVKVYRRQRKTFIKYAR